MNIFVDIHYCKIHVDTQDGNGEQKSHNFGWPKVIQGPIYAGLHHLTAFNIHIITRYENVKENAQALHA